MSAGGRDEIRELMARHNPVLPHEVREKMGGARQEEVLRRILRGGPPRRPRARRPALAVAVLGAAVAVTVSQQVPQGARPRPPAEAAPAAPAGPASPRITEDLARITRISSTEPLRDPPRPMASFPQAAPALLELAALAASRPRPVTGPWSYVVTEEWLLAASVAQDGTTSRIVPWVVRRWTPASGGGTYLRTRTAGRPFGGGGWAGVSTGAPTGGELVLPTRDRAAGSVADLQPRAASLSRSTSELRGQLLDSEPQTAMTRTRRLVRAVENLHSYDVVEPALSAALWRVLAPQDDLRSLGRIRDRGGRQGQAFGFEDGPLLGVFVVSSTTGGLLATELIRLTGAGGPRDSRPVVEEYRTYVTGRWVDGVERTS
ncbi:hypothetical protein [Streptosporangium carneum]|uniref:Uncharacterized protein n=1 Tax=Streptosporangium carneum TaxID=47481 RepID=A0A9W6I837_9ACTN|nr:hypothetical protein [Streptosporangium carneum]GLK12953.1 hypothetical protein GCM10017600_63630 [Streptosporangium carneum]